MKSDSSAIIHAIQEQADVEGSFGHTIFRTRSHLKCKALFGRHNKRNVQRIMFASEGNHPTLSKAITASRPCTEFDSNMSSSVTMQELFNVSMNMQHHVTEFRVSSRRSKQKLLAGALLSEVKSTSSWSLLPVVPRLALKRVCSRLYITVIVSSALENAIPVKESRRSSSIVEVV